MRTDGGGYRRDHLRALGQRIEVDQKELRITGSKSALLRTLAAAESAKTAGLGCPVLYRSGAPRPMKMGTTSSPWRYDATVDYALQPTNLRWPALFRYVSRAVCHPCGLVRS